MTTRMYGEQEQGIEPTTEDLLDTASREGESGPGDPGIGGEPEPEPGQGGGPEMLPGLGPEESGGPIQAAAETETGSNSDIIFESDEAMNDDLDTGDASDLFDSAALDHNPGEGGSGMGDPLSPGEVAEADAVIEDNSDALMGEAEDRGASNSLVDFDDAFDEEEEDLLGGEDNGQSVEAGGAGVGVNPPPVGIGAGGGLGSGPPAPGAAKPWKGVKLDLGGKIDSWMRKGKGRGTTTTTRTGGGQRRRPGTGRSRGGGNTGG